MEELINELQLNDNASEENSIPRSCAVNDLCTLITKQRKPSIHYYSINKTVYFDSLEEFNEEKRQLHDEWEYRWLVLMISYARKMYSGKGHPSSQIASVHNMLFGLVEKRPLILCKFQQVVARCTKYYEANGYPVDLLNYNEVGVAKTVFNTEEFSRFVLPGYTRNWHYTVVVEPKERCEPIPSTQMLRIASD